MEISLKRTDTFIPEWNGNRDLPDEQQIKFHHRFLGSAERKNYIYLKPLKMSQNQGADQMLEREMHTDGAGIAKAVVSHIEGLRVSLDNGKAYEITDIKEFYKHDLHELAAELEAYMIEISAVVDTKNFE